MTILGKWHAYAVVFASGCSAKRRCAKWELAEVIGSYSACGGWKIMNISIAF